MVPDPYKALKLDHDASASEIKKSYRQLAMRYHPDRLVARNASEYESKVASDRFADISTAYQLLSDQRRKRDYDHIYKYGGYDDVEEPVKKKSQPESYPHSPSNPPKCKRRGIGYTISDPVTYFFPKVSKCGRQAVAGINIPSRIHLVNPPQGGGLRFAYSSGEFTTCNKSGTKKFVSKTTQFVSGKKFSRVETTTVHTDGRKEIIIEGGDNTVRRRWTTPPKKKVHSSERSIPRTEPADDMTLGGNEPDEPWYMTAWNGIRKGFQMCHNPCGGEILVQ